MSEKKVNRQREREREREKRYARFKTDKERFKLCPEKCISDKCNKTFLGWGKAGA